MADGGSGAGQRHARRTVDAIQVAVFDAAEAMLASTAGWHDAVAAQVLSNVDQARVQRASLAVLRQEHPEFTVDFAYTSAQGAGTVRIAAARLEWHGAESVMVCRTDLAAIADDLPAGGLWLVDANWCTLWASRSVGELLGHDAAELRGRPLSDSWGAEQTQPALALMTRREEGIAEYHPFTFRHRDGSELPTDLLAVPLLGTGGQFVGAAALLYDRRPIVQAARESARRDAAITAISEACSSLFAPSDLDTAIQRTLASVGVAMAADRAVLFEVGPGMLAGERIARARWQWSVAGTTEPGPVPPLPLSLLESDPEVLQALDSGTTVVVASSELGPGARDWLEERGTYSVVAAPILLDGELWGGMTVEVSQPDRVWRDIERAALQLLATSLGAVVVRRRHEQREAELAAERDRVTSRLKLVLRMSPVASILVGLDYRVMDWNPAAESLFSWRAEEVIGQDVIDMIVPAEMRGHVQEMFRRVADGAPVAFSVNENLTAVGRRVVCEWHNYPVRESDGRQVGILCIAQDITERRRAQDQERTAIERLQSVIAASPLAIVAFDRKGDITLWNEAATAMLGWSEREVLAQRPVIVVPDDRPKSDAAFARVLAGEHLTDQRYRVVRRHGGTVDVAASMGPVRGPAGEISGVMCALEDITERLHTAATLQRAEQMYRAIVTDLPDGVVRFGLDLRITFANDATCRFYGRTSAEMTSQTILSLVPAKYHATVLESYADPRTRIQPSVTRYLAHRADGEQVLLEVRITPVVDQAGEVVEFQAVVREAFTPTDFCQAMRCPVAIDGGTRLRGDLDELQRRAAALATGLGDDSAIGEGLAEVGRLTQRAASLLSACADGPTRPEEVDDDDQRAPGDQGR